MARFEINERVKDFVDKKIASRKVVIFSKTTCPFCINAKKIFEEYQIDSNEIESIEIENDPDCSEIQSYLKSITGASTVPRVFINGQCIGGCNDTERLYFFIEPSTIHHSNHNRGSLNIDKKNQLLYEIPTSVLASSGYPGVSLKALPRAFAIIEFFFGIKSSTNQQILIYKPPN
ncbi:hypothetical protein NH340_JMT07937 [Sarcoptes scabiei]|nr:hypothetical protein NH340_JMT07937 [Sarcoptes scabiei]